jgi:hypothetical protein
LFNFVATLKGLTSNFFSPLSFVAVFGSGIRDKHPGSATLIRCVIILQYLDSLLIEIFYQLFHLLEIDTDPDRRALDADPGRAK